MFSAVWRWAAQPRRPNVGQGHLLPDWNTGLGVVAPSPGSWDGAGLTEAVAVAPPDTCEASVAAAEAVAARISTDDRPMGRPGRPVDPRSPFVVGMVGAAGVAVTIGLVEVVVTTRDVLVLMGLACSSPLVWNRRSHG